MMNTISILGSTGSIGRQTLDVAEQLGLRVAALTANSNVERMEAQCRKFRPRLAVMTEEAAAKELAVRLQDTSVKVLAGTDALVDAAVIPEAETVVTAVVGMVGLKATLAAIREKKLHEENMALEAEHPEWNLAEVDESGNEKLPSAVRRSLGFLLASIALWFIGYNAIETWFTTFADKMWGMALGDATLCLTIATAGAICSYIPVGIAASRVGRRRTILFGVLLLTACFGSGYVYTLFNNTFHPALYALFALVGVAWASINVNSLPMVVEMCKGSDVGKFTGYYYTASMAAQTITPIVAGWLLKHVSYSVLFLYSAVFVALAFFTMLMVRHGDVKVEAKRGLEAFDIDD